LRLIDSLQKVYALGMDAQIAQHFTALSVAADKVYATHPDVCG
jgi:hypothetical protein